MSQAFRQRAAARQAGGTTAAIATELQRPGSCSVDGFRDPPRCRGSTGSGRSKQISKLGLGAYSALREDHGAPFLPLLPSHVQSPPRRVTEAETENASCMHAHARESKLCLRTKTMCHSRRYYKTTCNAARSQLFLDEGA